MPASTPKELKATLWKAAEKLRGSLSAGHHKNVILGVGVPQAQLWTSGFATSAA